MANRINTAEQTSTASWVDLAGSAMRASQVATAGGPSDLFTYLLTFADETCDVRVLCRVQGAEDFAVLQTHPRAQFGGGVGSYPLACVPPGDEVKLQIKTAAGGSAGKVQAQGRIHPGATSAAAGALIAQNPGQAGAPTLNPLQLEVDMTVAAGLEDTETISADINGETITYTAGGTENATTVAAGWLAVFAAERGTDPALASVQAWDAAAGTVTLTFAPDAEGSVAPVVGDGFFAISARLERVA